ncbi:MAG: hypothetical protein CSA11_02135 [Chloroflexi bacterium]|nr:MAG: hypothetical protein CSB13_09745 [Chloroflexota bacterium]PIE81935.1 MAG: hypothetical protein CSA11_02135 [Chloroflexota bacterium]
MNHTSPTKEVDTSRIWFGGLVTIFASVLGNLMLLAIANLLVDIPPEFEPLRPMRISVFTVALLIPAIIVYAILAAKANHPRRLYRIIGWIFLMVSFIPDIAMLFVDFMPAATGTAVIILMLTHVIPGLIALYLLPYMTQPQ